MLLSLFPGIGLLDMAFERTGFCVVRGPDLLWGGDVRGFRPPPGTFTGVIGGPPCQRFSRLANIVRAVHGEASLAENLIPEFERIVGAVQPRWFLMENVPDAPRPSVPGYAVHDALVKNRRCDRGDGIGADQNRVRRFSFGTRDGRRLVVRQAVLESARWEPAVCASAGGRRASVALGGSGKPKGNQGARTSSLLRHRSFAEECALQGLPQDFLAQSPLTVTGKRRAVGNGVPLPMGLAVARAVRAALEDADAPQAMEAT